jgi:hypothetical protein
MFQQFPSRSQSTTRPPILRRRLHLNPDGLLPPTVYRRSLSPTSTTRMDSNRISNHNKTIPPVTGTTGNILLLFIRLVWPAKLSTTTRILLRTILLAIIHLKQQINFTTSPMCKFVVFKDINFSIKVFKNLYLFFRL